MRPYPSWRPVSAICLLWLGVLSCHSEPLNDDSSQCCNQGPPIFLASKLDDDDADGNPFDEDFPTINDEDDDISDHAWFRETSGLYHLFFHNEGHADGSDIEHYSSGHLESLDYVGVALSPNPQGWDSAHLWAPHVVASAGRYYLFYTGVSGAGGATTQRIGVAVSEDLMHWQRLDENHCADTTGPGCVYDCDETWTTWSLGPTDHNRQCRDPFVIWDAATSRWVMFATARSTNQFAVVVVAYSEDLKNWQGAGFIDATRRLESGAEAQMTGGQAENPFVMSFNGQYYLLFADWQDPEDDFTTPSPRTMAQYATSRSLSADATGSPQWVYRGAIPDPGVNAIEVLQTPNGITLMSQSVSNEASGDYDRRRQLRLKCIAFSDEFRFSTFNLKTTDEQRGSGLGPVAPYR